MALTNSQNVSDTPLVQLRVPPHSIEAEQSVLGGLLLDNQAWERVADILAEGNFYRDDHRRIYRHIGKLIEKNRPADMVTVFESIEQSRVAAEEALRAAQRVQTEAAEAVVSGGAPVTSIGRRRRTRLHRPRAAGHRAPRRRA